MADDTCVALLRGVNVSGAGKLPSALLAEIARDRLGLSAVKTYIQSGNLVFRTSDPSGLEERLANEIEVACGFRPPVFLRTRSQWRTLIGQCPFAEEAATNPKAVHVYLLDGKPAPDRLEKLTATDFAEDRWALGDAAIYLHLPNGAGRSKLALSIERMLKQPMTGRNWSTILALEVLLDEAANN